VLVSGAGIDLQLLERLAAQRILREHALDGLLNDALRMLGHELTELLVARTARIERIVVIRLLLHALAGHFDLFSIDHDHKIAGIDVRREGRLVLAAQDRSHARRQTAYGLTVRINQMPFAVNLALFRRTGNTSVLDCILACHVDISKKLCKNRNSEPYQALFKVPNFAKNADFVAQKPFFGRAISRGGAG
jgi:hypothetical protein